MSDSEFLLTGDIGTMEALGRAMDTVIENYKYVPQQDHAELSDLIYVLASEMHRLKERGWLRPKPAKETGHESGQRTGL